jgi:hypothetical protein
MSEGAAGGGELRIANAYSQELHAVGTRRR